MATSLNNSLVVNKVECESEKLKKEVEELEEDEGFSLAVQLAGSCVISMALQSATELGVFDVLQKAGPNAKLSANDIVSQLPCCKNPEAARMLDRILALLTSNSLLYCNILPDPQNIGTLQRFYSMTPAARFFAPDHSDGVSIGPLMTLLHDKVYLASWTQLTDAIREGGIAFNRVHGTHAFEYPSLDSRFNQVFNTAMMNHSTLVMKEVLERYKGFEKIKRLVDVGGGLGVNINSITTKYPHIHGINFDLPHVVQHAPSYLGVEHVGGDMFKSVPKADAIFMKSILHDWSDEHCLKLLKNCYDALPDNGNVIVLDAALPIKPENSSGWKFISQLDVLMMTQNPGGKERTEQEFMELATRAGFRGVKFECYVRTFWVMEFFK